MNKKEPQIILLISGIAAAGKGSVDKVLRSDQDHYIYIPSCTTRAERPGEKDGVDYFFINKETFEQTVREGGFVEWENVHQYQYGRRKVDVENALKTGKIPFIEADVNGRAGYKKVFGNKLVTIFIIPPSIEVALERLRNRGTETDEDIQIRTSRYEMELSHRKNYDYTIVNDQLEKAQKELQAIIKKELRKRKHKTVFVKTLANFIFLLFVASISGIGLARAYLLSHPRENKISVSVSTEENITPEKPSEAETTTNSIDFPAEPTENVAKKQEIKKKIAEQPPQNTAPKSNPISTTTNTDGTQTTTVATAGSISTEDLAKIASAAPSSNDPLRIPYVDETGKYPELGDTIKTYLKNSLKWRNEIPAMKLITLKNAGETGWNGEYLGSYNSSPSGDITGAYGSIILNSYYIENNYCSTAVSGSGCFEEYAKYIFSHEYGHHYTLYHKWVDLDLPINVRLPDQYYTIRPLSKENTATDYSLGSTDWEKWANCELEIAAEDYSYLYSGFGLHEMASIHNYPSVATKIWLDNFGSEDATMSDTEPTPAADLENPVVTILQPETEQIILTKDQLAVQVSATDNIGIAKIEFYFNDLLQQSWTYSSLGLNLNFKNLPAGEYHLRFKAYDAAGNFAETVLTVTKS